MNINSIHQGDGSSISMTPSDYGNSKMQKKFEKLQLRSMLGQLPQPQDDFEIVLPSESSKSTKDEDGNRNHKILFGGEDDRAPSVCSIVDSADVDAQNMEQLRQQRAEYVSTLSILVRDGLPHPISDKIASISQHKKSKAVITLLI